MEDLLADISNLVTSATAYGQAVDTLCGPLEADVRSAAQECWQLRDRTVQVKSGILGTDFRSKAIVVREAVFSENAEQHGLGGALAQWQEAAEGAVAAAALELKSGEQRVFLGVMSLEGAQEGKESGVRLQLLDAVLAAYCAVAAVEQQGLLGTLSLLKELALLVGSRHLATCMGDVARALPPVALVLQRHAAAAEWAAALLQPLPEAVVPVLVGMAGSQEGAEPAAVRALLAQCPLTDVPSPSLPVLIAALVKLAPSAQQDRSGAPALCDAVLGALCQLAGQGGDVAAQAGDAMLCLLLAAARGVAVEDLPGTLGLPTEGLHPFQLSSTDLTALATGVFSPLSLPHHPSDPSPSLPMRLANLLNWRQLGLQPKLATRALLVLVGLARSVAAAGGPAGADSGGYEVAVLPALQRFVGEVLGVGEEGPLQVAGGGGGTFDEGEGYLLCVLEAPLEHRLVEAVWLGIQLSMACILCTRWLLTGQGASAATDLLSSQQVEEKVWRLSETAGAGAAVRIVAPLIGACASAEGFDALLSMLSSVLGAAVSAQGQHAPQAVAAMQQAVAECIRSCLAAYGDSAAGGHQRQQEQEPAPLIDLLGELSVAEPRAEAEARSTAGAAGAAERAYAAVCAWLSLVLQLLSGLPGPPEGLLLLTDHLTQAAYYLLSHASAQQAQQEGQPGDNMLYLLASSMVQLVGRLGEERCMSLQQRLCQLSTTVVPAGGAGASREGGGAGTRLSWLALLACWLLDALTLRNTLKAREGEPEALEGKVGTGVPRHDVMLSLLRESTGESPRPASDRGVEEALQIEESAVQVRDSPAAVALWQEFFLRYEQHSTVLEALVSREDLLIHLSTLSQQYYHASPALAAVLSRLSEAVQHYPTTAPSEEGQLSPFRGDAVAARELGRVHAAWHHWTADAVAPAAGPRQPATRAQNALPTAKSAVSNAELEVLVVRWHALEEKLDEAKGLLRLWARRGEKQRVGREGEEGGGGGKEGSVPDLLAEAQSRLWDCSQRWSDQLSSTDSQLRAAVCRKYKTLDVPQLQARADEFQEGQRVPPPEDPHYTQEFMELRQRARAITLHFVKEDDLVAASSQLQLLEHLLLRAPFADMAPDQAAGVKSQLLTTVGEVLLDGSTPPLAAPFMTQMFERAVGSGAVVLSADAKMRLVPRISRAMRTGARGSLREREAVVLLRVSLDPEALLEGGKLAEFYDTLLSVLSMCKELSADTSTSLLHCFDATRFAVMALEGGAGQEVEGGDREEGEGPSGSTARASEIPSLQSVLETAAMCLGQKGAEPTGAALIEGLLCVAPATCFACCLHVVLMSAGSDARSAALGMLCKVPAGMLPPAVVAEALEQIAEGFEGNLLRPPHIPFDLLRMLLPHEAVLASMQAAVEGGGSEEDYAADKTHGMSAARYWTAKLGAEEVEGASKTAEKSSAAAAAATTVMTTKPLEEAAGSGSGGQTSNMAAGSTDTAPPSSLTPAEAPPRLLLLPVPTSGLPPLFELALRVVGAWLQCLLRTLGSGVDGEALSEEVMQLLGVVFDPVGEGGPWVMAWVWRLYKETFHPFLTLAGPASDGAATAAFRLCWSSLPWDKARFHAASPSILAELRGYLASGDRAVVELLHGLSWTPVLSKVLPSRRGSLPAAAAAAAAGGGVFSLGDEEEEEEMQQSGMGGGGATLAERDGGAQVAVGGTGREKESREEWGAQLGLLALHTAVVLRQQDLPDWLELLLYGCTLDQQESSTASIGGGDSMMQQPQYAQQQGLGDVASIMSGAQGSPAAIMLRPWAEEAGRKLPLLPSLLSASSWDVVEGVVTSSPGGVPWLLLPLLMAPQIIAGDVAARVVHASALLGQAALKAGTPSAAAAAACAVRPLLLFSLCQGRQEEALHTQPAQQGEEQQLGQLELPPEIPAELLEGTVEGEQLRAQLAQNGQRDGHFVAAGATVPLGAQQPTEDADVAHHARPLVLVQGCWRLGPSESLALLENVLLRLASCHASLDLVPLITQASCPEFNVIAQVNCGERPDETVDQVAIECWRPPSLLELVGRAGAGASEKAAAASKRDEAGGQQEQDTVGETVAARVAVLGALIQAAVQPAVTILTQDPLPFANAALPWDTASALYLSSGRGGGSRGSTEGRGLGQPLRALRHRLSSLMHPSGEAAGESTGGGHAGVAPGREAGVQDVKDVSGMINLLGTAIEDACYPPSAAPLAACLLRLLLASQPLHSSHQALTLADNLLRHFATTRAVPAGGLAAVSTPPGATSVRGLMRSPSSSNSLLPSAVVIPVFPASHSDTTVTNVAGSQPAQQPHGATPEVVVPESMQHAVAAAEGLPEGVLLGVAEAAAGSKRPLLAAFACQRLRAASMLMDKGLWQNLVIQVLRVGTTADYDPDRPFQLVAVWLEMMSWVGDSRWRRLPPGSHQLPLLDFLDVLELRVVVLNVLSPDQLVPDQGQGGSPSGLLASLKAMAHNIPGLKQDSDLSREHPSAGAPTAAATTAASGGTGPTGGVSEGEGTGLGLRLSKGLKSMLGRGGKDDGAGRGPSPDRRSPLAALRAKLAGTGGTGAATAAAAGPNPRLTPDLPSPTPLSGPPAQQHASPAVADAEGGGEPLRGAPVTGGDGDERGGRAVRQKLNTGLQKMGNTLSVVRTKLTPKSGAGEGASGSARSASQPPGQQPQGGGVGPFRRGMTEAAVQQAAEAERERDVLVRLGLAAFAVAAYIKTVLCPSLPRQAVSGFTGADSPLTPTLRSLAAAHQRRTSSLTFEEVMLRELDMVLETRSELDLLETLVHSPLLAVNPAPYTAFMERVPRLLAATTGVTSFQEQLSTVLLQGEGGRAGEGEGHLVMAVLRAG